VGFICRGCGQYHDELPQGFKFEAPADYYAIAEAERSRRCMLSSDQCVLDDEYFFVAGNIDLQIAGSPDAFVWTVWVSLGRASFERASKLWHTPSRESEPPSFGWLRSSVPGYPETLNLKTQVHTSAVGVRPTIELETTDHPLSIDQRVGISRARAEELGLVALHPNLSAG